MKEKRTYRKLGLDWSDSEAKRTYERQRPKRIRPDAPQRHKAYRAKLGPKYIAKQKVYNQRWKEKDPEGYRKSRERRRLRRLENVQYRIQKAMSDRIRNALKVRGGIKRLRTMAIVGCNAKGLQVHLERQFKRGMTWTNYGKVWEIDHITPVSYFDLTEPAQLALCFNWQNLRPLWSVQNHREQNRRGTSQLHLPFEFPAQEKACQT